MSAVLSGWSADLKTAQERFQSGEYAAAIALAQEGVADRPGNEEWQLLLSQALLATGRYPEALNAITNALAENRWSVRLCWQAREVFLSNGKVEAAREQPDNIIGMVSKHPRDFNDAASLVVFGQAALVAGEDPKRVLDSVFSAALKAEPKLKEAYLASGGLALEKHDFALAARRFAEAAKVLPEDPDIQCGLAQAYAPSDQALMLTALETSLQHNSNHVASLLLLVDHNLDAENYEESARLLDRVLAINAWLPEAWAYRAVLAHLQNRPDEENTARQNGLKFWSTNPLVDYVIGHKLSQNYRFAEGASHQRQALKFDSEFLPAKAQLAQDLLRLGEEPEGWRLAEEVQKQDNYDVEAYNLSLLRESMSKFSTLTNEEFVLRLNGREASIYGTRILELLSAAHELLCAKYGLQPARPTFVEVFPEQKDFAVRTFGMPGNPGYLGVCFGRVITATSPNAHRGHPVNWQTVLWHEFCHVVTLQLTHNKMPRWLSEGISVYEERQANPAWGERMNPAYRKMVLGEDLTPISELSAAFLSPRSALHLQFAYYESSLVVDFLVQRFGLEQLKAVLRDLGDGKEINATLEQHSLPMPKLEQEFADFARQQAEQLAPGLDWTKPTDADRRAAELRATNALAGGILTERQVAEQTNFYVLTERARQLVEQRLFEQAKAPLERLVTLYPSQTGDDSADATLATVYRELGQTNAERRVLSRLAEREDDGLPVYRRLMELGAEAEDWPAVELNARRYLAADPLVELPYRFLAQAAEKIGDTAAAIGAYRALLELDPQDPASVHFHLARALQSVGDAGALREVLQALEEAPRYHDALRLLQEIKGQQTGT